MTAHGRLLKQCGVSPGLTRPKDAGHHEVVVPSIARDGAAPYTFLDESSGHGNFEELSCQSNLGSPCRMPNAVLSVTLGESDMQSSRRAVIAGLVGLAVSAAVPAALAMDNSALEQASFREHKATYGLVYRLPTEVVASLENTVPPALDLTLKGYYNTEAAMKEVADEMNQAFPADTDTRFREVSIVEIGYMGNVLREFYRVSLENGSAWDVASGR
jgi:hypothetical protein